VAERAPFKNRTNSEKGTSANRGEARRGEKGCENRTHRKRNNSASLLFSRIKTTCCYLPCTLFRDEYALNLLAATSYDNTFTQQISILFIYYRKMSELAPAVVAPNTFFPIWNFQGFEFIQNDTCSCTRRYHQIDVPTHSRY